MKTSAEEALPAVAHVPPDLETGDIQSATRRRRGGPKNPPKDQLPEFQMGMKLILQEAATQIHPCQKIAPLKNYPGRILKSGNYHKK